MKRDTLAALEGDPKLTVVRSEPLIVSYLTPNAKHKFLDDRRMRQALRLAIDRKTFIALGLRRLRGRRRRLPAALDVEPRRHAAADAGRREGQGAGAGAAATTAASSRSSSAWAARSTASASASCCSPTGPHRREGAGAADGVGRAGTPHRPRRARPRDAGAGPATTATPTTSSPPTCRCAAVKSGGNKAQWCDPAFDELIDEARRTNDVPKRTELYQQAQRICLRRGARACRSPTRSCHGPATSA